MTPPSHDTILFAAEALAHRCGAGQDLVLEGVNGGNGALVWLRSGGSVAAGGYSLLAPRDTVSLRGAAVSVRYMTGDMAHGFSLDSGSVAVTERGNRLAARVRGSGLETEGGLRVGVAATFARLPVAAETVACRVQP